MIRIWDCFMLEGPKVLFRFAVALLAMYEEELLQRTDTISVMKVLKASVRLTFDYEGLSNLAYNPKQPFPSREYLKRKQNDYAVLLSAKLHKRKQIAQSYISSCLTSHGKNLVADVVAFCDNEDGKGFLGFGNQNNGQLWAIDIEGNVSKLRKLNVSFDCRILSIAIAETSTLFVSLLSGTIVSLRTKDANLETIWELKTDDVALKVLYYENYLFVAMANGTITVIESALQNTTEQLELYNLPIGAAPISDMFIAEGTLWLAVACKIIVLDTSTLTKLKTIYVASSTSGVSTALFEKIRCLTPSPFGVWTVTMNSTLIQLWDQESNCQLLYDISYDHLHRIPSLSDVDDKIEVQITTLLFVHGQLWVGTNDGHLFIYLVQESVEQNLHDTDETSVKYPAGKRLSARLGQESYASRKVTCYIPTTNEAEIDELNSTAEFSQRKNFARKFSVSRNIYSGHFHVPRKNSFDSLLDTPRSSTSSNSRWSKASWRFSIDQDMITNTNCDVSPPRVLTTLPHQQSVDSAVSVFSEHSPVELSPASTTSHASSDAQQFRFFESKLKRKDLDFDDTFQKQNCRKNAMHNGLLMGNRSGSSKNHSVILTLEMKLKITDKPVKCAIATKIDGTDFVVTCAGDYGDAESILKWSLKNNSIGNDEVWINDPVNICS